MKLQDLRTYYKLREYQISHLLNARKCHGYGKWGEQQLFMYLLFWADAMYEADELFAKIVNQSKTNVVREARGYA